MADSREGQSLSRGEADGWSRGVGAAFCQLIRETVAPHFHQGNNINPEFEPGDWRMSTDANCGGSITWLEVEPLIQVKNSRILF